MAGSVFLIELVMPDNQALIDPASRHVCNRRIHILKLIVCGALCVVKYLQIGAAVVCDDRKHLLFPAFGLALNLGDGRALIAGLWMRPVGTGHSLLCHGTSILPPDGGRRAVFITTAIFAVISIVCPNGWRFIEDKNTL